MIGVILALLVMSSPLDDPPASDLPRGYIRNDSEPWFVQMENGSRYGCFYLGGDDQALFSEDEYVVLVVVPKSTSLMIGFSNDSSARVYCVDMGRKATAK